jgi:hypothetical protein
LQLSASGCSNLDNSIECIPRRGCRDTVSRLGGACVTFASWPGPLALSGEPGDLLDGGVFVCGQVRAAVSFAVARTRLADLARGDGLLAAASEAYGQGVTGLADDPPDPLRGTSRLAEVPFGELVAYRERAHMALRWQAIAADGTLFPVLDADLALAPAGEDATMLDLAGVYRPPPGTQDETLDPAGLQRAATATTRAFLDRLAAAIGSHPSAGGNDGPADEGGSLPPAAQAP